MIFDNGKAEQIYCTYANTGDKSLVADFHDITNDLINAIASALDQPAHHEDLRQEAHLKLQIIITKQKYRTGTRCSLYTFLSAALKNAMIDYLRKLKDTCEFTDYGEDFIMGEVAELDEQLFRNYYQYRFPSKPGYYNIATYIVDTLMERLRKPKVLTTLTSLYDLPRAQAILLHNSVELFMLASRSDIETNMEKSISCATNGKELTLYPESVLLGYPGVVGYKKLLAIIYGRY